MMNRRRRSYLLGVWSIGWAGFLAGTAAANPEGERFFEEKIRPLLAEHCYGCHSPKAEKGVKGGLYLDTRAGWEKGGDSGPAIVPGNPDASLLIRAVRYSDENLKMPPKNQKLSSEQVALLEEWVRQGAPDPRTGQAAGPQKPASSHWAFQPVRNPPLPKVSNPRWIQSPVDAFVLARLDEQKMKPSRPADKRTLIRRVTLDLIGLPPTMEEVEAFLEDRTPEAFARVVDRLLASPLYGERWGRHWLDVARYADTKGYLAGNEERKFAYSWTYRDYVIRAFNEDLPYDQFIREQIAADALPLGEDKRPLAALGYLTLGRRFLNNVHDIVDDRIDVVTRGLMGLTVTCARCHDHKYDPIPTKDYYSLAGIFHSSTEPAEKPLLGKDSMPPQYEAYLAEKKKREEAYLKFKTEKEDETLQMLRRRSGEFIEFALEMMQRGDQQKLDELARERKLDPGVARRWIERLTAWKKEHHPVFAPLLAYLEVPESDFAAQAKSVAAALAASGKPIHPLVHQRVVASVPASLKGAVEAYAGLLKEVDAEWEAAVKENPAASALPDAGRESLRQVLYAADAPANLPRGELQRLFEVRNIERTRELKRQLDELDAVHPGAPPRAMALVDNPNPADTRVLVRGNPGNPGPRVPRQFLEVLSGPDRKPFKKGSGRLELAESIASRENPLTARVMVNRVWLQHFGAGLVRTPSDFGLRSDPPTHPDLLDYLASQFMENGWSVKRLHRMILLSSTYQQASDDHPRYVQSDPSNTLLWKMNRRRLDFEALRDSLLYVAGRLEVAHGGLSVDIVKEPFSGRRTVYGFIDRQNLPSLYRTFDFASPDTSSAQRFYTSVPQQALFMMNNPFVQQISTGVAQRPELQQCSQEDARIERMYQIVYQRLPSREELALARAFLESSDEEKAKERNWERLAQALLVSNEFAFVD